MSLVAADVDALSLKSESAIETWLRVGLEGYFLEGGSPWSFDPLGAYIGHADNIALDIRNIYRACPAVIQAKIRVAVAHLMAAMPAENRYYRVFEALFHIAAVLQVTEIFRVVPTCASLSALREDEKDPSSSLFATAITTVAEIAIPTEDSYRCLQDLITCRQFESAYAGLALVALCRVMPEQFPEHFAFLRGAVGRMFKEYEVDTPGKRRLAIDVFDAVPLNAFAEGFNRLSLPVTADPDSDNWFLNALCSGKNSVLRYRKQGNDFYLSDVRRPEVWVRVPDTSRKLRPIPSFSESAVAQMFQKPMEIAGAVLASWDAINKASLEAYRKFFPGQIRAVMGFRDG